MQSIQAQRERLAALNKEAKNLLANKGDQIWDKADQDTFDGLMDQAERVQNQIAATQRMLDLDAENNFADANLVAGDGKNKRSPIQQGLDIFLRKSSREMSAEEATMVRNTMSTTTGSEGGYTVQPLIAKDLIDLIKSYAYMRKVASQITTESGVDLSYPTSDGTAEVGELVAQNASAAAADAVFGTRALNAYKFGSKIIAVPIELLQDSSIDITAMVMKRMRDRIGRVMNQYFSTGTGTAQPFGIATAAAIGKTGLAGQTLTVIYDDLVDMVDSLDAGYLDIPASTPEIPNPAPGWMFNQSTRRVVRKIKDTAGRPIWTPSYDEGMSSKTPEYLLGYPVYLNNDIAVMAANAKSIAFGNFQYYYIRDAMQVTLFRFDDSAYMSKGQIGFLGWARAGGNLMDLNSIKFYQNSAT